MAVSGDSVEVATSLVVDRFSHLLAAVLGGSAVTSRRTNTSDLDIVIVLEGPPAPFRERCSKPGVSGCVRGSYVSFIS